MPVGRMKMQNVKWFGDVGKCFINILHFSFYIFTW
jgi:hypothetical protein